MDISVNVNNILEPYLCENLDTNMYNIKYG